MYIINLLSAFIIPSSLLFLGFLVLKSNSKSATNRYFFIMSLASALSALGVYLTKVFTNSDQIFWALKFTMIAAIFVAPTILLFISSFPKMQARFNSILLLVDGVMVCILSIATLLNLMYRNAEYIKGEVVVSPGPFLPFFGILFLIHLLVSSYVLFIKFRSTKGREKEQVKYLTLGILITLILIGVFDLFFVVVLKRTSYVTYGVASFLIFEFSVYYTIRKHRLMDIRLVVARTITYTILITFIGIFYVAAAIFLSTKILGQIVNTNQTIIYTLLTLVVTFSFDKLKLSLEHITDKLFFKGTYNSQDLLSYFGEVMSSTIDLYLLGEKVLNELVVKMKVSRGAFVLFENNSIYEVIHKGFIEPPQYNYKEITELLRYQKNIVFDDIYEDDNIKQLLRDKNISLVYILRVKSEIIGVLLLGEKSSGDDYNSQDLNIIDILIPEVSVAIQNAQSYDKIKKFNMILTDEVKKATRDLQQANNRLKELDKLKDDFVSVASHELRTPMTAVKSYIWMCLNRSDVPLSPKLEKYLKISYSSTERLINLVNDMLNVSRIESGRIEITPKVFDIKNLIDNLVLEIEPTVIAHNIKVNIDDVNLLNVFADPEKVQQIMMNLLGNAVKFTKPGGLITISFFNDGKMIEVSVKDTGVGISKEDLSKLFQKFGRLNSSYIAAATSGGTGLGLYISKSLVDLMHGYIKVASEGINKGTTFTFALPVATKEVISQPSRYTITVPNGAKKLEPSTI